MIDCLMISVPPISLQGPHIGPAILKSYAEAQGYSVKCVNPSLDLWDIMEKEDQYTWPHSFNNENYNLTEIITQWVDEWLLLEPKLIGLSTHVWDSEFWLREICNIIRLKCDIPICMGGPAAIELGQNAYEEDLVDYYVVGDGEEAFINILEEKYDHPSINTNKPHAITNKQFQDAPGPDFSDTNFERYRKAYPKQNRIFLIGTRGCVFNCSFCNVPALMKYRFKDGKKFATEIKNAQRDFNPEYIEFADSLINGSLSQYHDLIETLAELNEQEPETKPKIVAFYRIRPMKYTREKDFQLMAKAGFFRLKIGVESGSQSVREHIGKTETEEEIIWTFDMCRKYNIKINLLIIVGYPTETEKDFEDTMNMLRMVKDNGYDDTIDRVVINELYVSTDTKLHRMNITELPKDIRQERLDTAIHFVKDNFNGTIMVFTDDKKSTEVT